MAGAGGPGRSPLDGSSPGRAAGPSRGAFDALSPDAVLAAVEGALAGLPGFAGPGGAPDGVVTAFSSYANRVYGLRLGDGRGLVAKFYRPGRWSEEALREEHRFVRELAEAELPVAAPYVLPGGDTLGELHLEAEGQEDADARYWFALYPKKGGRNFDAEEEGDWRRLGALAARLHLVGESGAAPARATCDPALLTAGLAERLLGEGAIPAEFEEPFADLVEEALNLIAPRFAARRRIRLHGDLHRGNILDRPGEGLLVFDFDDMMNGPAVQDLWLLLPDRAPACRRELELLMEGYRDFRPFDEAELPLIEPLRFMRMVYFLAWRSAQRDDLAFRKAWPDWGTRHFWEVELASLREQAEEIG